MFFKQDSTLGLGFSYQQNQTAGVTAWCSICRHGLTIHRDVLTGSDLCTWLVEVGLASDRKEAVHYGQHLLNGELVILDSSPEF